MKTITLLPKRRASRISTCKRFNNAGIKRLQIKKILVPLDFSAPSHHAIKFSLPLLKSFGAELHLVHVSAPDVSVAGLAAMPIVLSEAESAACVRLHLKHAAKKCRVEPQTANIHALHGEPFEQICRLARDIDIDLIIIATRGQTGFKHLLLGSTAERVVRYSPCPVLVVRSVHPAQNGNGSRKTQHAVLHVRKILVPVDFSNCSRQAVEYAKALAKKFHAALVLLHSVCFQYHVTSDEYARYDYPLLVQEADKAAHKRMRELASATESDGIEVESLLKTGHVGEQICDQARSHGADLIVTSTHGWTGFKHVLLGSTAEYVVQHARCPVLVISTHDRPGATSTKTEI